MAKILKSGFLNRGGGPPSIQSSLVIGFQAPVHSTTLFFQNTANIAFEADLGFRQGVRVLAVIGLDTRDPNQYQPE